MKMLATIAQIIKLKGNFWLLRLIEMNSSSSALQCYLCDETYEGSASK